MPPAHLFFLLQRMPGLNQHPLARGHSRERVGQYELGFRRVFFRSTPTNDTAAILMKSRRRTPASACVSTIDCSVGAIPIPCVTRYHGKARAPAMTGIPPGVGA